MITPKEGGFDLEKLYARATVTMQKLGKKDGLLEEYKGTGEEVGVIETYASGSVHALTDLVSDAVEGIWMAREVNKNERSDMIAAFKNVKKNMKNI